MRSSGECERGKSRGDAGVAGIPKITRKSKRRRGKEANVRGGFLRFFRSSSLFPQLWSDAID